MHQPATILLVDDLAANRETLTALLEADSYRLVEAADGPTALQLAAETPPDLVLLDIMMPGMDGFEVCRRLRADARLAEVPVIMVTALDDQASRLAGIEAGADDFTSKPFNRTELRARVRTITRLNRYRRLLEQREQFHWVVEQAPDGYLLINADDEILFANPRARLWLGLPLADRAEALRETFLATARRDFLCEPTAQWQNWPAGQNDTADASRLLVRPETANAHALFLAVSIRANVDGSLLRLTDVTGNLATRRDQRSFQAMVSHKLRTPLNALHGGLELLSDIENLRPAEAAEFVAMARAGASRLLGAVDDVLRFATLSQRALPNPGFALDRLEALVRSVAASLALPMVHVDIDSATRSAGLACAPETLEWILFELLENAQKSIPGALRTCGWWRQGTRPAA